jgi:hypothetical protein
MTARTRTPLRRYMDTDCFAADLLWDVEGARRWAELVILT